LWAKAFKVRSGKVFLDQRSIQRQLHCSCASPNSNLIICVRVIERTPDDHATQYDIDQKLDNQGLILHDSQGFVAEISRICIHYCSNIEIRNCNCRPCLPFVRSSVQTFGSKLLKTSSLSTTGGANKGNRRYDYQWKGIEREARTSHGGFQALTGARTLE